MSADKTKNVHEQFLASAEENIKPSIRALEITADKK